MKLRIAEELSLPVDAVTQTFLVVGKRGSGKTNTCVRLAEQFHHAKLPFVVVDPVDTWYGLKASKDGRGPGLDVVVFGGKHQDLPLEPTGGELAADVIVEHRISAVLSVKHFSGRERARFVSDFAERLFRKNSGEPIHLFLEEAHEVAPQNPYKGEEEMLGRVTRIWKLGRSSGLGGSAITQRPASLSKNITTQAEILIVHRMLGPQDVAAVREWIKYHGESDEILSTLSELKTGEAWIWAPDFPEEKPIGLQRVKILERETFDSSATPKAGQRAKEPKELAPVDLEALRSKMAATIERAKAEDPKELRRRIAELERDLRAKPLPPVRTAPATRVEVPVLKDAQIARLEKWSARLTAEAERHGKALSMFWENFGEIGTSLQDALRALAAEKIRPLAPVATIDKQHAPGIPARVTGSAGVPRIKTPASSPAGGNGRDHGELGKTGARRMLVALAQHPDGLRDTRLSLLTGIAKKGGTWRTYIAQIRSAGYVAGDRSGFRITDAGLDALGDFDPLPTGAELLKYWQGRLGDTGMRRIFDVLVDAYPRTLMPEDLAQKSGIEFGGGTWRTYMAKLRGLELVHGRSEIQASEELFD